MKNMRNRWRGLHLVDRCLLILFGILLLQVTLNLFLNETTSQETSAIDVVVRTSAAGIFGYLISANFNQRHQRSARNVAGAAAPQGVQGQTAPPPLGAAGHIGFSASGGGFAQAPAPPELTPCKGGGDCTQILVITAVGVLSLCVLLVLRYLAVPTSLAAGTVSQLRDFVSGSVGFLISCSTGDSERREI
ncbi:MAG: hypothetical protein RRY53_00025 [Pseudoflavonifractor sp.]